MKNNYESRGGSTEIRPGPCDPVYGCPPPTQIECIQVEKIYNECKNIQVNEDEIFIEDDQAVTDAICYDVVLDDVECTPINNGRVKVTIEYTVKVRLVMENGEIRDESHPIEVEKTFFLNRAGEKGLDVKCEVFLECLECFVEEVIEPYNDMVRSKIICCIGKLTLVKVFAKVQLLIPAYGFCPQPPECDKVEDICPDFQPEWPPYPEQDR